MMVIVFVSQIELNQIQRCPRYLKFCFGTKVFDRCRHDPVSVSGVAGPIYTDADLGLAAACRCRGNNCLRILDVYKLYWAEDTGAFAPQVILEEVGVAYERCDVDTEQGEEMADAFLAINPRGQIPAMQLDDGSVLTESAAIVLHIAESHPEAGLLPAVGSRERAALYRWLFFAASNLYEGILRIYYSDRYTSEPTQADAVQAAARIYVDDMWGQLADAIGEGPFLLGQNYSVIDPYLLMLSRWHENPDALFAVHPKLQRLCAAVRERPAVERVWVQHYP
jgi:glutathione S-transferase